MFVTVSSFEHRMLVRWAEQNSNLTFYLGVLLSCKIYNIYYYKGGEGEGEGKCSYRKKEDKERHRTHQRTKKMDTLNYLSGNREIIFPSPSDTGANKEIQEVLRWISLGDSTLGEQTLPS